MKPSDEKLLAEWFWIDRWVGSSAFTLTIEERGLYREMLSQAWRRGARLPTDEEAIRRVIGATEKEWRRCWPKVRGYWRVDGDSLVNDTQLEVYGEALAAVEAKRAKAQTAAKARWGKPADGLSRQDRVERARRQATHTAAEWQAMLAAAGHRCLRCQGEGLITKDHVVALTNGGSDGIENLQPLCDRCNAVKGGDSTDYRTNHPAVMAFLAQCSRNAQASPGHCPPISVSDPLSERTGERGARPRRLPLPPTLVRRRNLNAAFEGPIFDIPQAWADRVVRESNGRLTVDDIARFGQDLTDACEREGQSVDPGRLLAWLDRCLATWVARRAEDARRQASAEGLQAHFDRQDEAAAGAADASALRAGLDEARRGIA